MALGKKSQMVRGSLVEGFAFMVEVKVWPRIVTCVVAFSELAWADWWHEFHGTRIIIVVCPYWEFLLSGFILVSFVLVALIWPL